MSSAIDPHIFRAYDIRGKAHAQLTADACRAIGQMFGTILRERYKVDHPKVVVGRDARTHGAEFEEHVVEGLMHAGCSVFLMGKTPSPLNYFTICSQELDGGVQITASHNPKEDNGLKLQMRDAEAFSGEDLQVLRQRIDEGNFLTGEGSSKQIDAVTPYIAHLTKLFANVGSGKTIVVDGGNGIAGPVNCAVLRNVGCLVEELYTEPDGEFPNHPADPSKHETLRDLQARVTEKEAHLGFAFDGDGDRLGVVDETGKIRTSDEVLLLLAEDHLSRHKGAPVIFTVSNSEVLNTKIEQLGGQAWMTKVGHSFVEHAMREHGALLGGEQSGHFFCAEDYYGFDDALVAALRVLKALGDQTVTDAMSEFPQVFQAPELRPHCPDNAKGRIVQAITEHFSKNYAVNTLDGARIDFGEGAWAGIRQSNTSPCLSICMEARSEEKLRDMEQKVLTVLKTFPEISWK